MMLFWKILVALSDISTLALVGSAFVWCDAKSPDMKRKAERVRDAAILVSAGVFIAIVIDVLAS